MLTRGVFCLGRFGSGVVSYFVLLRWLLLINILPLTGLWVCFVFIPQLVVKNSDIVAPLGNGSQLTSAALKGCLDGLNVSVPPDRNASAELFNFLTDLAKNSTETNVQWYDYLLSFFTGTVSQSDESTVGPVNYLIRVGLKILSYSLATTVAKYRAIPIKFLSPIS